MPFEIPESWEWSKVEDIFDLNPKNNAEDNITVGFIPMEFVSAGFGYSHTFEERKWEDVKKGYCHFKNGDIGIAKISPCFENRKSTIFFNLPNNIGAGSTELVILRGYIVCTEFYLYVFQSAWYISEGTKYFKGVVGQQRVKKDIFTTLQIPVPPLAEQIRIVAEIKKWLNLADDLETNKKDLQEVVKQTKSKILDLTIHGNLVPQDPSDEPANELLKRITPDFKPCDTSHYGNLPSSWCVCHLGDIVNVINGKNQSKVVNPNGPYPIYGSGGIIGYADDYLCPENCTIIGRKGTINNPILVKTKFWNVDTAFGICPSECIDYLYLYYFCKSFNFTKLDKSTTLPSLTKTNIEHIYIPLPPLAEQKRIVAKVMELLNLLDKITAEL